MRRLAVAALSVVLLSICADAQVNVGSKAPESTLPFTMTELATFNLPWRLAFLPDGRMLVTEKPGALWLVTQQGQKTQVSNVPKAAFGTQYGSQNGMLGVYLSPKYATDHNVYLTYAEPDDADQVSGLALARATLTLGGGAASPTASLDGLQVIWRQMPKGKGGQEGAAIAFSPDGNLLYLTVGERQRFTPAQDPNQELGKILRLTLDGKPAPGNPGAGKTGAASVPLINPPADTEKAKDAPVVSTYTFPGPNVTPAEVWTSGHRTPYGLAFGPDGRLWEVEHGPQGGDELNLIEVGRNYGWPDVSYGRNYNGVPIPSHDGDTKFTKPVIYWNPVIGPGNMMFYKGAMFPQWKGSALIGGMVSTSISRITFDGKGGATAAERWNVAPHRVRDIAEGPDGALWVLEDKNPGGLLKLTPVK